MTATATAPAPPSGPVFVKASGLRKAKDRAATGFVWACFLIALVPLVWVLWEVISKGAGQVADSGWWTSTQRNINPDTPGGGVIQAVIGTLIQVLVCSVVAVPIAVLVGVYLVEYGTGRLAKATTFMVDVLTGIPSIVAALFIYAVFVQTFGVQNLSGSLVSLALMILMLPVVVRSTEEMLRLVPNELREASYALGVPKWKTIVKVVIPTAFTGLITGVVLGLARVAGETAPLLLLVGYTKETNWNPFSGSMAALPSFINAQFNVPATSSGKTFDPETGKLVAGNTVNFAPDRLWGAALTLIIIVLILNVIARLVGRLNKVAK